jgi:hypothetical protein
MISFSIPLAARQDKGKDEKGETFTGNLVKVEGAIHCQKADPGYAIGVPDRSGHALTISQRRCTWTKPLVVAGARTKKGLAVDLAESMEGEVQRH